MDRKLCANAVAGYYPLPHLLLLAACICYRCAASVPPAAAAAAAAATTAAAAAATTAAAAAAAAIMAAATPPPLLLRLLRRLLLATTATKPCWRGGRLARERVSWCQQCGSTSPGASNVHASAWLQTHRRRRPAVHAQLPAGCGHKRRTAPQLRRGPWRCRRRSLCRARVQC